MLNVVEFFADSGTTHFDLAGCDGWVGNIHFVLSDAWSVGELGHWHVSDSGHVGEHLLVGVANLW